LLTRQKEFSRRLAPITRIRPDKELKTCKVTVRF
jgi:hypothetical protein